MQRSKKTTDLWCLSLMTVLCTTSTSFARLNPSGIKTALARSLAICATNNPVAEPRVTPDDPCYQDLQNIRWEGGDIYRIERQWYLDAFTNSWKVRTSATNTLVAVVDSGITTHSDLTRIKRGMAYSRGVESTDLTDKLGHGTKVTSIIGADGNNQQGVCGVLWNCNILATKTSYYAEDSARCIAYALEQGAKIINCSWGFSTEPVGLKPIFEEAGRQGAIILCAAPNNDVDLDVVPDWPTSWRMPHVVTITSTDKVGAKYSPAGWGRQSVKLAAPGRIMITCKGTNEYCYTSGTSMATAVASGAFALAWEEFPHLSNFQLIDYIVNDCAVRKGDINILDPGRILKPKLRLHASPHQLTCGPVVKPFTLYCSEDFREWKVYSTGNTNPVVPIANAGTRFFRACYE